MSNHLNADEARDLDVVQKLLAKAAKTEHEPERDAFLAKAQQIMLRRNWTTAEVERAAGRADGKREEQRVEGGFYLWQRELWREVARLNFCFHFVEEYRKKLDVPTTYRYRGAERLPESEWRTITHQMKKRHRLIGRAVNVAAATGMAQYLEGAIDRALAENIHQKGDERYKPWANAFREGATSRLLEKIRRMQRLAETKEEKARKAAAPADPGGGRGTRALTLTDVKQQEEQGNYDFVHGDGAWAKLQAELAADAERRRLMQEAYTAWAAANPKEAMSKFEYTHTDGTTWCYSGRTRGGGRSYENSKEWKRDPRAYAAGRDAGDKISLAAQVDGNKRRIGRG